MPPICPSSGAERAPHFLVPGAFPHEGKNEGEAEMFPESREDRAPQAGLTGRGAERLHGVRRSLRLPRDGATFPFPSEIPFLFCLRNAEIGADEWTANFA